MNLFTAVIILFPFAFPLVNGSHERAVTNEEARDRKSRSIKSSPFRFSNDHGSRRLSKSKNIEKCMNETLAEYNHVELQPKQDFVLDSLYKVFRFLREDDETLGQKCDLRGGGYFCDIPDLNLVNVKEMETECAGEIRSANVVASTDSKHFFLSSFPLCVSRLCSQFDMFFLFDIVVFPDMAKNLLGDGSTFEIKEPGVLNKNCLDHTLALYGLGLDGFAPSIRLQETPLTNYNPFYIPFEDYDKFCEDFTEESTALNCNASKLYRQRNVKQTDSKSLCEDEMGGKHIIIDQMKQTVDGNETLEVSVSNIPLCLSKMCTVEEGVGYFDFFTEMYSYEGTTVNSYEQKMTGCDENAKDEFFHHKREGLVVKHNCEQLRAWNTKRIIKACSKVSSAVDDLGVARDVCPETCGRCASKSVR